MMLVVALALVDARDNAKRVFVQQYGIPQACQSVRDAGLNKWPTLTEFCTSTNLALAQPLDACANLTACVAWAMVPQFGGRTDSAEALKDCRAYCSIQQSPVLYSNCIHPCTGAAYTGLNCGICSTIDANAYRRISLPVPSYKRDQLPQPHDVPEEANNREARGGGGKKTTTPPPTTLPATTTPAPTTNAYGICGTNNVDVPASNTLGECMLYMWNAGYDPYAEWAPYYCPDDWTNFAMPELTVLIDSTQNGRFVNYHTNFGLVDMSASEIFSRALSLGKRIFAVQQCSKGGAYCNNACTAL